MPNVPVLAPAESLFKLKFHQVSIYHNDPESAVEFWEAAGFQNWTKDECVLRGTDRATGKEFFKNEREWFNYDILPLEFCYFQYDTGYYRLPRKHAPPFMALMATYVENLEEQMARIKRDLTLEPLWVYDSISHQNPYLVRTGMKFHKALYDTTEWLGFDVKLTQKVLPGDPNYPS